MKDERTHYGAMDKSQQQICLACQYSDHEIELSICMLPPLVWVLWLTDEIQVDFENFKFSTG